MPPFRTTDPVHRPIMKCRLALAAVVCTLAACGGGGGGGGDPVSQPVPPAAIGCANGEVARLVIPVAASVGRNAEVALQSCGSVLSDLQWTQLGGASLALMSARSQALSIEPPTAGSYRFAVSYRDGGGVARAAEAMFDVAAADATAAALVVRGEPSVWGGGVLSLRAWTVGLSDAERLGAQMRWSVVDGPATQFAQPQGAVVVFNAPVVAADSVLLLRATASLADGRSLSQEFSLLVQPPPRPAAQPLFAGSNAATRVYPYRSTGPHAAALTACIYGPHLSFSNPSNVCTLGQLPLLGQVTRGALPSIEQVMQRVLVSNEWMGEVFEEFLRTQDVDGDFRRMLNSTTAIVIGSRVRPSFYWSVTGAIYLDAANLWLTPAQRDTLSESPDPRQDFGAALNFNTPWRYVLGNRHAVGSFPVSERGSRPVSSLRYDLGRILYHELAHAGDFLPPRVHGLLRDDLRVYESSPAQTASLTLSQQLPHTSAEMIGLARVQFYGETPNAQQLAYTPEQVSAFLIGDRVTDDYSYSMAAGQTYSPEDLAMLIEEAMMQLRFGVFRDFAVTDRLGIATSSADLPVRWGQRGRIGEASIRPRLALVLDDVMPWVGAAAVSALAPPVALRPGLTWGMNLDQAALAAQQPRPLTNDEQRIEADQQRERTLQRAQNARIQALPVPGDRRGIQ